jgi:hypothetical protein
MILKGNIFLEADVSREEEPKKNNWGVSWLCIDSLSRSGGLESIDTAGLWNLW